MILPRSYKSTLSVNNWSISRFVGTDAPVEKVCLHNNDLRFRLFDNYGTIEPHER